MEEAALVVKEAENAQLSAQRASLEVQLAEQQAVLDKISADTKAQASASRVLAEQSAVLKLELEAKLKEAAEQEGVRSAFRQAIQDCQRSEGHLRHRLEALKQASGSLRESEAMHREGIEDTCNVERNMLALADEKSKRLKMLQKELRGLVSDMRSDSMSLTQLIDNATEDIPFALDGTGASVIPEAAHSSVFLEPTLQVPSPPRQPLIEASARRPLGKRADKENMAPRGEDSDAISDAGHESPGSRARPSLLKRPASDKEMRQANEKQPPKLARLWQHQALALTRQDAPSRAPPPRANERAMSDAIEDLCTPESQRV